VMLFFLPALTFVKPFFIVSVSSPHITLCSEKTEVSCCLQSLIFFAFVKPQVQSQFMVSPIKTKLYFTLTKHIFL